MGSPMGCETIEAFNSQRLAEDVAAKFGFTLEQVRDPAARRKTLSKARVLICVTLRRRGASYREIGEIVGRGPGGVFRIVRKQRLVNT